MATENTSTKKRKQRYLPHNKPVKKGAYPLHPGVQGFFITCDGGRERQASHEAINVIDSFFEEYVHGAGSNKQQEAIPKQFMNKKTKFVYSDSSEDEDGDDDGIGNNIHRSTEEKDLRTDNITDANCETLVDEKLGSQNEDDSSVQEEIQEHKDGKEEVTKKHKFQEGDAGEQPIKKQCVEISSSKSPNLASSKMEEKSVDKLIEAELAELGDKSKRRFSNLDSGCNGVVFVQMRKRDDDPNPKDIVQYMMTSLASTRKHMSRFMLRVLPIELSCYASEEEIVRAIKPFIAKYFPVEAQNPHKFAVLYEARANTGIERAKIIDAVAKSVPSPHKVDLSHPDIHIVVQIVKTVCLIGLVEKYKELAKFNVRQLTSSKS
ncbi:THUMP domain-containing protein 1 homolog [Coffea eugenioides]|uniref:THUMP domain-containing protein 1 homolog n=1 Tax=Coffea eugenioides TaxID=49369 RepID=UPI000F61108E|nr:THUMP domain-containing protein 1 homolog [Coffea eugenioides]